MSSQALPKPSKINIFIQKVGFGTTLRQLGIFGRRFGSMFVDSWCILASLLHVFGMIFAAF